MKHETPPPRPPTPRPAHRRSSAAAAGDRKATVLDGVYRTSFTREELANSPLLYGRRARSGRQLGRIHAHLRSRARHPRPARRHRKRVHIGHLHRQRQGDHPPLHRGSQRRRDLHRPLEPLPRRAHLQAPPASSRRRISSNRGAGFVERDLGQEAGSLAPWALDPQPSLQGLNPVGQAAQARATRRVGTANPIVPDLHDHQACLALRPRCRLGMPGRTWRRWSAPPRRGNRRPPPRRARAAALGHSPGLAQGSVRSARPGRRPARLRSASWGARRGRTRSGRRGRPADSRWRSATDGPRSASSSVTWASRRSAPSRSSRSRRRRSASPASTIRRREASTSLTRSSDLRLQPGVGDRDTSGGRHRVDQVRVIQHGGVVD